MLTKAIMQLHTVDTGLGLMATSLIIPFVLHPTLTRCYVQFVSNTQSDDPGDPTVTAVVIPE